MNLEQSVGQQLMVGVPGGVITPEIVALFRETHAGGLILYRPNVSSAEGLRQFISRLEEALGRRLLIAVDHEGGRVIHLTEGVTVFPDNLALGATGNSDFARQQGRIEARELRRLGIDLNLAPTIDVLTAEYSPNIGIRSYSRDASLVAAMGAARIQAMQDGGLSACAKHFPGQGQSPLDAHLSLPVLPTTWQETENIHIRPFEAAIRAGVDTVMSSHPVYPNLDESGVPATFSRKLIHDYLRGTLGFKGAVLSDDLEMGALRDLCPIGESACRAVEAGHDLVLVCHEGAAARECYRALLAGYQSGRLKQSELEQSLQRLERLKNRRQRRFEAGKPLPDPEGAPLARKIAKEAVSISGNEEIALSLVKKEFRSVAAVFPHISGLESSIYIEEAMRDEAAFVRKIFSRHKTAPARVDIVGLDPTPEESARVLDGAKSADLFVFFCYDAHLFPATRALLEQAQEAAKKCVVVLMRDPFDNEFVSPASACVTAFGFRAVQLEAAVDALFFAGRHDIMQNL